MVVAVVVRAFNNKGTKIKAGQRDRLKWMGTGQGLATTAVHITRTETQVQYRKGMGNDSILTCSVD